MTPYYFAVALLAALNLAGIVLSLALWARLQRLEKALAGRELPAELPAAAPVRSAPPAEPAPPAPEGEPDRFSAALLGGEMTVRLAQERETREPPEKYRYITGLADQGMSAGEIARVLHLAPGEVEQLLTLARLGKG